MMSSVQQLGPQLSLEDNKTHASPSHTGGKDLILATPSHMDSSQRFLDDASVDLKVADIICGTLTSRHCPRYADSSPDSPRFSGMAKEDEELCLKFNNLISHESDDTSDSGTSIHHLAKETGLDTELDIEGATDGVISNLRDKLSTVEAERDNALVESVSLRRLCDSVTASSPSSGYCSRTEATNFWRLEKDYLLDRIAELEEERATALSLSNIHESSLFEEKARCEAVVQALDIAHQLSTSSFPSTEIPPTGGNECETCAASQVSLHRAYELQRLADRNESLLKDLALAQDYASKLYEEKLYLTAKLQETRRRLRIAEVKMLQQDLLKLRLKGIVECGLHKLSTLRSSHRASRLLFKTSRPSSMSLEDHLTSSDTGSSRTVVSTFKGVPHLPQGHCRTPSCNNPTPKDSSYTHSGFPTIPCRYPVSSQPPTTSNSFDEMSRGYYYESSESEHQPSSSPSPPCFERYGAKTPESPEPRRAMELGTSTASLLESVVDSQSEDPIVARFFSRPRIPTSPGIKIATADREVLRSFFSGLVSRGSQPSSPNLRKSPSLLGNLSSSVSPNVT